MFVYKWANMDKPGMYVIEIYPGENPKNKFTLFGPLVIWHFETLGL